MAKKTNGLLIAAIIFVVLCVLSHAYFGYSFIDVKLSEENLAGIAFIVLLPLWFIVGGALTVISIVLTCCLIKTTLKISLILLGIIVIAAIFSVLALFVFGEPLNTATAFLA
ncbi:MAG: hypothetical protein IJO25_04070 [Clostridia bacterium]|nr:hypothetical protein [Clostridia bacterium]